MNLIEYANIVICGFKHGLFKLFGIIPITEEALERFSFNELLFPSSWAELIDKNVSSGSISLKHIHMYVYYIGHTRLSQFRVVIVFLVTRNDMRSHHSSIFCLTK